MIERVVATALVWTTFAMAIQLPPHNLLSVIVSGLPAALFALGTLPRIGPIGRVLFAIVAALELQIDSWQWAPNVSAGGILLVSVIGISGGWVWARRIASSTEHDAGVIHSTLPPDQEGWRPASNGIGWINDNAPRRPRSVEIIPPVSRTSTPN